MSQEDKNRRCVLLSLIQAAIACECCSFSKKRLERGEFRSRAITSLQEHIDIKLNLLAQVHSEYVDVDQLADFTSFLGEECLLCDGQRKVIYNEVLVLIETSKELDLNLPEEDQEVKRNVISFFSRFPKR